MVIFMGYSMVFRKPGPILGHLRWSFWPLAKSTEA